MIIDYYNFEKTEFKIIVKFCCEYLYFAVRSHHIDLPVLKGSKSCILMPEGWKIYYCPFCGTKMKIG